jgi:hypothetical protein
MKYPSVKYDVKNEHGQLTFGSFRELRVLYQREFVSDDDLVRRHGDDRWVPAGLMPELKGSRQLVKDRSTPVWVSVALTFVFFLCYLAIRFIGGIFGLVVGAAVLVPVLALVTTLAARGKLRLW